jgi:hypothetical protein
MELSAVESTFCFLNSCWGQVTMLSVMLQSLVVLERQLGHKLWSCLFRMFLLFYTC